MTNKWQSLPLFRNLAKRCECYDCRRKVGVTTPSRPDCLGLFRDAADGRFTALTQIDREEGKLKTVKERVFIGT